MDRVELVIIDPQNDFCDVNGALYVDGAADSAVRLADMIDRISDKIARIHVTLDTHHYVDIAHPIMTVDADGNHPDPFTIITHDDVVNGIWTTTNPSYRERLLKYTAKLEENNRYPLCVWPPHCLIGTWGHNVVDPVSKALARWESKFRMVNYVTKGSNPWVEHYSAVQSDVDPVDLGLPSDPSCSLNMPFLETLARADLIPFTGQALSHCVANTGRDVADNFGDENIEKIVLLTDTTDNVTGFDNLGADFINEMTPRGMKVSTSVDFLS